MEEIFQYYQSFGLDKILAKNLIECGYFKFLEIQELVIPTLLKNNSRTCIQPRHILASAPTGSGKTLAYVIPILQALHRNVYAEVRLKALAILPTRELAQQVFDVFCKLSENLQISIAIITGQTSFDKEQMMLIGKTYSRYQSSSSNYHNISNLFSNQDLFDQNTDMTPHGRSLVDILVCTPGRLQDHLQFTPGFTLEHLRFLVLDEADRLLGNAYHNWVKSLIQATNDNISIQSNMHFHSSHLYVTQSSTNKNISHKTACLPKPFLTINRHQHHVQRLLFSATLTDNPAKLSLLGIKNPLVFKVGSNNNDNNDNSDNNAIDNPENINTESEDHFTTETFNEDQESHFDASIIRPLSQPIISTSSNSNHFSPQPENKYYLPNKLTESICVCDTLRRPLVLATLLYQLCRSSINNKSATQDNQPNEVISESINKSYYNITGYCSGDEDMIIVFTSSVITTNKLCKLLQYMNNQVIDTNTTHNNKIMISSNKNESITEDYENPRIKKKKLDSDIKHAEYLFNSEVRQISRISSASERQNIISLCRQGCIKILISTDHMARGIDLPNVKCVINYDCPTNEKMYLHRVGRTARGNNSGHSITILKIGQMNQFRKLYQSMIPSKLQQTLQQKAINKSEQENNRIKNTFILKTKVNKSIEMDLSYLYKKSIKILPLIIADSHSERFQILES